MRNIILVLGLLCFTTYTFGQGKYGVNWAVGRGNSYIYNFDNQTLIVYDTNYEFYLNPGSSCISDSNGNLKIICDGYDVMDSTGGFIDNGDTLVPKLIYNKYFGHSGYPQSSIILPFSDAIYYVFTPTASDYEVATYWNNPGSGRALFDLLLYHKVDMKLNGGTGKVVKKAVPLLENVKLSKTQMMACRHANGMDWWLLKQAHDTNMVYRFLVTKDSIYNKGMQGFAEPHFTKFDLAGQSMFNQDGSVYSTVCSGRNELFLSDFERCTGQMSNPRIIPLANHVIKPSDTAIDVWPMGICFSPNGEFIYVVKGYNIFQYELNEPDSASAWYHVANMDTIWQQFQGWGSAYLGPDNKMYIGNWNGLGKAMSLIEYPNVKGAGCGFCPKCFQFPKIGAGNPPCMPNYALGADLPCWPLESSEIKVESSKMLEVYPNPASTVLYIQHASGKKKELYNSVGQLLFSTIHDEINVMHLAKGVYYIRCENKSKKVIIE